MRNAIKSVFAAAFLLVMSSCPLLEHFVIVIENNATDIAVSVVRLRDFNAQENVTDNLLSMNVDPGNNRWVFVPSDQVGNADALKVRVAGTNPQQPISFAVTRVIDGGFAAGKTVSVTVDGSPTQSVSIDVEASK